MKKLMLTTALTAAMAVGVSAQTATEPMPEQPVGTAASVPAFLASDFTGMTLYSLDTPEARAVRDERGAMDPTVPMDAPGAAGETAGTGLAGTPDAMPPADGPHPAARDRMRWTGTEAFLADRDSWNSVGSIGDIVMTMDGEIRGVLVDVGGFLGIGARTVMVDIDELHFVRDEAQAQDVDDFFVVIAMSEEELEALPEFDRDQLRAGFAARPHGLQPVGMDETGAAPANAGAGHEAGLVFGPDHRMLEGEERTADRLIGADVFDINGDNIGTVDDIVVAADNSISGILVDVGGFLGIGAHTVMLPIDDARIGWSAEDEQVRVQVNFTREQLEAMPEHSG